MTTPPRRLATLLGLVALLTTLSAPAVGAATTSPPRAALRPAGASISGAECRANQQAGQIKFVSPFGYDASAGILDVYAALQLGYFKQLCLDVTFNGSANPALVYPDVSSGVGTITGEGSAADDLVAIAHGQKFTAISTFGDSSDYALLTRSSITNLRQLAGKTLGVHGALPVVLSEILAKAHVSKVNVVNDNSYTPSLLINGPYQALQAYQSNEPLTLDAEGYAKDFREWTPAQFGVQGTFNVQVVNTAFLHAHPGAITDFLRAELHAFFYCASNVATCVEFTAKVAGKYYIVSHEEQEWRTEVALAEHHTLPGMGVGVQSTAEWTPELKAVVAYKLVAHAPSLATAEDTALAGMLYHGTTLIWP